MTRTHVLAGAMALATVVMGSMAVARSGKASFYKHSGAMITAANEPVGSILRATNPQNGKSVQVRVVGSGPFVRGRVLDLSTGAFKQLYGGLGRGVGPVQYTVVSRGSEMAFRGGSPRSRHKAPRRSARRHSTHRRHR